MNSRRILPIFLAAGLVLATLLAFAPVRENDFVSLDDRLYVVANDEVRKGWTLEGVAWAWGTGRGSNWHPLTWMSHMLDVELFGLDPVAHHGVNLALHIVNALLLFFVLREMTGSLWRSAFVAALFSLHPLRVESVAWVAERKDLLSGFFWLLTMAAYTGYVRRPGILRYAGVALALALGLLAKPMAVTLPIVLLLLDYWPLERPGALAGRAMWPLIREKIPLFVIAGASAVVTLAIQSDRALVDWETVPLASRVSNACLAYILYLRDLVFPGYLAVLYPFPQVSPPLWQPLLAFAALAGVSVAVAKAASVRRYLSVGWGWYLITLIPVIGLVQVGFQTRADRYTYIPSIGLLVILGWGAAEVHVRWGVRKVWFCVTAALILVALVLVTRLQVGHWRDSVALYERALAVTSGNYPVHTNLARVLISEGREAEAGLHYRRALEIKPDYLFAHYNYAVWLQRSGQLDAAIEHYRAALRSDPSHLRSRYNLAVLLAGRGERKTARDHYVRLLEIEPDHASAHHNLGNLLKAEGEVSAAIGHYRRVVEIEPEHPRVHYNWGHALQLEGKLDAARDHYRRVGRVSPDYAEAWYTRGIERARAGRLKEAIEDLSEAIRLRPGWSEPQRALAELRSETPLSKSR